MRKSRWFFLCTVLLCGASGFTQHSTHTAKLRETAAKVGGVITVDILENGSHENYWHYRVHPANETVTKASEQRFANNRQESIPATFARPAGAITACKDHPKAQSPDGHFVATCIEVIHRKNGSADYSYSFVVTAASTQNEVLRWHPSEYRGIDGFAWSPDSKGVAVLNSGEHYGKSPLELLAGAAGHPVPHNTVYLDVFEVDGWKRTEFLVRKNVKYAFARILSWE